MAAARRDPVRECADALVPPRRVAFAAFDFVVMVVVCRARTVVRCALPDLALPDFALRDLTLVAFGLVVFAFGVFALAAFALAAFALVVFPFAVAARFRVLRGALAVLRFLAGTSVPQ